MSVYSQHQIVTGVSATSAARLYCASLVRQLNKANTWTTLRIATRLNVQNGPANMYDTPYFALGLCSGQALPMSRQGNTDHFVGVRTNTGTPAEVSTRYNFTFRALKKVSATETLAASDYTATGSFHQTLRWPFFVDITRASPYSLKVFYPGASFAVDYSDSDFDTDFAAATPSRTNCVYSAARTVSVDEGANGTLDTVNIYWSLLYPYIDLDRLRVAVLA